MLLHRMQAISITSSLGRQFLLRFFACLSSMHVFLLWSNWYYSMVTKDSKVASYVSVLRGNTLQQNLEGFFHCWLLPESTIQVTDMVFKPSYRIQINAASLQRYVESQSKRAALTVLPPAFYREKKILRWGDNRNQFFFLNLLQERVQPGRIPVHFYPMLKKVLDHYLMQCLLFSSFILQLRNYN